MTSEGSEMNVDVLAVKMDTLHSDVSEIKAALNELSKAITKLALVEQQQAQIAGALERAFKAIDAMDARFEGFNARVGALETAQPQHTEVAKWVDRGLVALAGAGAVLIGKAAGIGG
jgi:chromosome segregation ATPase